MSFNNIPPNGFPALPDVEDLEAVVKDVNALKLSVSGLTEDVSDLNDNKVNQITIAPFFNSETSYDVGDLVYYNGLSYRCTNAHEGAWDADDFTATTISNELNSLMSGLNGLIVAEDRQLSFVDGKCEVSIPSDYILIAAIGGATLDFVAGFTLISGPTRYALFLKDTATIDRSVRLVYASKYILLSAN